MPGGRNGFTDIFMAPIFSFLQASTALLIFSMARSFHAPRRGNGVAPDAVSNGVAPRVTALPRVFVGVSVSVESRDERTCCNVLVTSSVHSLIRKWQPAFNLLPRVECARQELRGAVARVLRAAKSAKSLPRQNCARQFAVASCRVHATCDMTAGELPRAIYVRQYVDSVAA